MVIQVCTDKKWTYVCSDYWTTESAQVACKQLGFSESGITPISLCTICSIDHDHLLIIQGAKAKRSWRPKISLPSKLICSGKESRLIDCGVDPTCYSDRPAAVICKRGRQLSCLYELVHLCLIE